MKSIDFKSLIIGILGTLLVIACTGAKAKIDNTNKKVGRYQVSCASQVTGGIDCVVIDTISGGVFEVL